MYERPHLFSCSQIGRTALLATALWALGCSADASRTDDGGNEQPLGESPAEVASCSVGWSNSGGNAARNGQSCAAGPAASSVLWQGARSSSIGWQPYVDGTRAFVVRSTGSPGPDDGLVVALDVATGRELWSVKVPFQQGDWFPSVVGVSNGRVYATRAGNGNQPGPRSLYALSQETGAVLWTSAEPMGASAYDDIVFAPNGDLVVGDFRSLRRVRATDGVTLWKASRLCSVSEACGAAIFGNSVYIADASTVWPMHKIKRYDLNTGAFSYQTDDFQGGTVQNTPFVGPDGTIYFSRTQNNAAVDYFYAFTDSGSSLTVKWRVPAGASIHSHFTVGVDGSVYMFAPGKVVQRLDPKTGAVLATSKPLVDGDIGPVRMLSDRLGRLYVSNGRWDAAGTIYAFEADLTERWRWTVTGINVGGPALAADGTLLVAGTGTTMFAFR